MGKESKIQWTDHTFNPWRGCTKVSPGCKNCYAEQLSRRNPAILGVWGDNGTRVVAAESAWREPLKWDREADKAGVRRRVFCASLADVFEDRPELVSPRVRLFHLINDTPNLDWLLLTKRPQNVRRFYGSDGVPRSWAEATPPNLWLGTSVEDQARADERIPMLLQTPAAVRFVSYEPALGPVDWGSIRWQLPDSIGVVRGGVLGSTDGRTFSPRGAPGRGLDWVIVGGESGTGARPFDLAWARSTVAQCRAGKVACFVKQMGARPFISPPDDPNPIRRGLVAKHNNGWVERHIRDPKGGDPLEWPEDLRIREFPGGISK